MLLTIDNELRDLIPPLTSEEFEQLEQNILEEGIREALIVWNKTIVDGHNRYDIALEHGLDYDIDEREFESKDEVINWMIDNQLGRRNLSPQQQSYLRGKRYSQEKKSVTNASGVNQFSKVDGGQNVPQPKTAERLAKQYGVTDRTIKRDEQFSKGVDNISRYQPELKNEILSGKSDFTSTEVRTFAKEEDPEKIEEKLIKRKAHVSNNSGNNEWYTPPKYIDIAREVMGSIDTDPATSELANRNVQAKTYYTEEDNGLDKEWHGNVWMNPPYAQPLISQFSDKLIEELDNGNAKQAMVLVNNATDTVWFNNLAKHATAIWFIKGRIKFIDVHGNPGGAPLQGQCVLYFGDNVDSFAEHCEGLVAVVDYRQRRD